MARVFGNHPAGQINIRAVKRIFLALNRAHHLYGVEAFGSTRSSEGDVVPQAFDRLESKDSVTDFDGPCSDRPHLCPSSSRK